MPISKKRLEKRHRLRELFYKQLETLKSRGCPEKITDILLDREDEVMHYCPKITIRPNRIPFLPVITPAHCSLEALMAMVRNGKNGGKIEPRVIPNKYPVIDAVGSVPFRRVYFDPYYIIDVEDGTTTLGVDALKAGEKIVRNERSPLTVNEVISLCIYTDVLTKHRLWAVGSRWEIEDNIPGIALETYAYLDCTDFRDSRLPLWGTPSCKIRVGL